MAENERGPEANHHDDDGSGDGSSALARQKVQPWINPVIIHMVIVPRQSKVVENCRVLEVPPGSMILLIQKTAYLLPYPSVVALDTLQMLKLSYAKRQVAELTETGISG